MYSLEPTKPGLWRSRLVAHGEYRLCLNYSGHNVCNWAVPAHEAEAFCISCRLTTVLPDITWPDQRVNWYKLETAKRRLIHSLLSLALPVTPKSMDPKRGLAFEFKARGMHPYDEPVITGHVNGTITINADEADDAERERRRRQLHEPYRTVLGHMRHEVGHYYWDRLIAGTARLGEFRYLFGDERQDYEAALSRHYEQGAQPVWSSYYVSSYCSAHPWEDWAETWAHYLHMVDTLDTASACGVMLKPKRPDEPSITTPPQADSNFDQMIQDWLSLTYVLNNLNRGLGLADPYPFVLSGPAIGKLRFVHNTIQAHAAESRTGGPAH